MTSNISKLHLMSFLKGLNFTAPFYTLYFLSYGQPVSLILFSQVFYSVFSFLSEVPTGIFADKFGHKKAIVIGNLVNAAGNLSMGVFPSAVGLFLNNSIQGIGEAFISGSQEALYYESFKKERQQQNYQKSFGNFLSLSTLGFIISTLFSGLMMHFFGEKAFLPLIVFNTTSILITAWIGTTLKPFSVRIQNPIQGKELFKTIHNSFKFIRSNSTIFALTIVGMLTLNGEYILRETYQQLFISINVPLFWIGLALSGGSILNIIVQKYAYLAEKLLALPTILLLFNLTLGGLYLLLSITISPVFAVGLYVLLQGLYNAEAPIISDYVNEQIKPEIRATVLSTISLAKSFAGIITKVFFSILIAVIGLQTSISLLGLNIIFGILFGYYILTKCGCTYRIKSHQS